MPSKVTLSVDAMGGDFAPDPVLRGVEKALSEDVDLNIVLCGDANVVEPFADSHERCSACVTTETIGMGEHPGNAVRKKKDSSIVVGCRQVKEGHSQGFFSAGSTGACLAAATLIMGRIRGIKRPALAQLLPVGKSGCILCDVGANADCKPEYILQFASMAAIYSREVLGVEHPRVGLLNIGEEDAKGNALALHSYDLLSKRCSDFAGNCEPEDIFEGRFDVVVTDGFTGNIALKSIESTAAFVFDNLKEAMSSGIKQKIGAVLLLDSLRALKKKMNPEVYGGCPLLGVSGACVIGHGSSNAEAVKNGILVSAQTVRGNISGIIAEAYAAKDASRGDS